MLFACLAALLSFPTAAYAQGSWWAGWGVKDEAGKPVAQNFDGSFTLCGAPTGSASNTYPPTILAIALGSPYTVKNSTQTIDCAWLANCYSPNIVATEENPSLTYLFGGTTPVVPGFSLSAGAANYARGSGISLASVSVGYPFQLPNASYYPVVGLIM